MCRDRLAADREGGWIEGKAENETHEKFSLRTGFSHGRESKSSKG